jgi:hypothetical protein
VLIDADEPHIINSINIIDTVGLDNSHCIAQYHDFAGLDYLKIVYIKKAYRILLKLL